MGNVAAFIMRGLRLAKETFSDDATGKLSWQAFMAMALTYRLCKYLEQIKQLSDTAFLSFIGLIALLVYGPTLNLSNYMKGIYGGFRTPDTQNNTQNNTAPVDATQNVVPPAVDINNPNPQP